jgi:hypothetical protein
MTTVADCVEGEVELEQPEVTNPAAIRTATEMIQAGL